MNAASLARQTPAVYVVEDAHWIDEVSESMLADFLTVIPQTRSLVLLTYRPEYRGRVDPGARCADDSPCAAERFGDCRIGHASCSGRTPLSARSARRSPSRAAGNPFFAEEIVRELAERGVLHGQPGAYVSMDQVAEVSMPATLQATIAARIDRLDPKAKRTLSAAAVIGSRLTSDLLTRWASNPVLI